GSSASCRSRSPSTRRPGRAPPATSPATTDDAHRIALPRDLTDEITAELIRARIRVARRAARAAALESLLASVSTLERQPPRPATELDLLAGGDPAEGARKLRLVQSLRESPHERRKDVP